MFSITPKIREMLSTVKKKFSPTPDNSNIIPEGHMEVDLFKGNEITKIVHNDEWFFLVDDLMHALDEDWEILKSTATQQGANTLNSEVKNLINPKNNINSDFINIETFFRIVQSSDSKKTEPFKKWIAKAAYNTVLEKQNPELAIRRAITNYQLSGRDIDWIERRINSVLTRKTLTDEWDSRGVQSGIEYAILTDTLHKGTFDVTTKEHKDKKSLKKSHTLRDHMTGLELAFVALAEEATKEFAKTQNAIGFQENRKSAQDGGEVAGSARKTFEEKAGHKVLSDKNFLPSKKHLN